MGLILKPVAALSAPVENSEKATQALSNNIESVSDFLENYYSYDSAGIMSLAFKKLGR